MQFQIFGRGNTQVIRQEVAQSLSTSLVACGDALKGRYFASDEVKNHLFDCIDQVIEFLNQSQSETLNSSKYMVFPFKPIAVEETLQKESFIRSILDALSVMALCDADYEVCADHINIKINGQNIFGIYYTDGQLSLRDSYMKLRRSLNDKRVNVPNNFVCIALDTQGEYVLDERKIINIVTDIFGESSYIRMPNMGPPKCLSLSSYIISESESLDAAKSYVKGVLGLE